MADPIRSPQRAPQRRVIYTGTNRFDFDKSKIPPDKAYKWARVSADSGGQFKDVENQIMCEMNGWVPVPAERHPELAGMRPDKGAPIVRGGLMLMEQPKEYEQESRDMEKFEARNTLEEQIQRLGLQARRNGARGIKRTMDQIDGEVIG